MNFLYQIFIQLFCFGYWLSSFFTEKAKKGWQGRKKQKKIIKALEKEEFIWMHCSSVGEFEQGRPVLEAIKKKYPKRKIALSFFSPSGFELRKNYPKADIVFYLPLDTRANVADLLENFNPKILILVKYDYWLNLLKALKIKGIPVVVISAIFRENQYKNQIFANYFFKALKNHITHFFVQHEKSAQILESYGFSDFSVVGDTRFDRVQQIASQKIEIQWLEKFKGLKKILVLGSTWHSDEEVFLNFLRRKLPTDWKAVIVPHEINQQNISHFKEIFGEKVSFYSKNINPETEILVVDAVGFLSQIYAYADTAYVGGGFNKSGVHNTLEPAVFGLPTVIGPRHEKFNEVQLLIENQVVFPIENEQEFEEIFQFIQAQNPDDFKRRSKEVFNQNLGATLKILDFLEENKLL